MDKLTIAALTLVAALAACGSQTGTEAANAGSDTADVDLASAGAANAATPADTAAASEAVAGIPAAVLGNWALVPGDCTTKWGDAKGLLTITATELRFYESRGKLGKVLESSPTHITADFDFQGEGEEWQRRMTLARDGEALVRTETGEGAAPEPFRYQRCPA
jgi:hypothetical protein